MIEPKNVVAGAYFLFPHPDIPGHTMTSIVTEVKGDMVTHYSPHIPVREPWSLSDYCKRGSTPSDHQPTVVTA